MYAFTEEKAEACCHQTGTALAAGAESSLSVSNIHSGSTGYGYKGTGTVTIPGPGTPLITQVTSGNMPTREKQPRHLAPISANLRITTVSSSDNFKTFSDFSFQPVLDPPRPC